MYIHAHTLHHITYLVLMLGILFTYEDIQLLSTQWNLQHEACLRRRRVPSSA